MLTDPKLGSYRFRIGDYRVIFDIEGEDISLVLTQGDKVLLEEKIGLMGYNFIENYTSGDAEFEYLSEYDLTVYIPYSSDATRIEVTDSFGKELDKVEIRDSSVDSNFISASSESSEGVNSDYGWTFVLLVILLVVICVVLVYVFFWKKKKK